MVSLTEYVPMITATELEKTTVARLRRRLLPFLFIMFVVNWVDRTNMGFAALQMNQTLSLSPSVFGLGVSAFFAGYLLCIMPAAFVIRRVGARRWIGTIAVAWGVTSAGMAFVSGPMSLYLARFLLGCAEAGFQPGILFYLTLWFPERHRAGATSVFMSASVVTGVISSPISGALLSFHAGGLAGWQWMFIAEALPAICCGLIAMRWLSDRPEKAFWLSSEQREWLLAALHRNELRKASETARPWLQIRPSGCLAFRIFASACRFG